MMKYYKYIHGMSSSYKTFPISTLSIFVLLLSSVHGYPQGNSRNATESNVTITTKDSSNTTLITTLPSQTPTENISSPSTSTFLDLTNSTTTPESSQETTLPPSTLLSSSVSNTTTVESSSTETSQATEEVVTYTDPSVNENLTTSSLIVNNSTTVEGEEGSITTITVPNTSTDVNNTNSIPDSTTNTLITDRNETDTTLEVGSKDLLSTTPSRIFTTSTEHELVSNSFESSSTSSLSFSTPVEDTITSSATEPSTLPPEPSLSTPSNYLHTGSDESLDPTTTEEPVTLIDTTTHTSTSTHSVTSSSIITTTLAPIYSTNSPYSSSLETTTIAIDDEPSSTTILIHNSSEEEDVEQLEVTTSTPYFVEEPIKTSKSPNLTTHDKGDGRVKSGMNNNQSLVMVKMEEKLHDLQYQIYALCGSFGVISLLLIVLLVALAYSMSKLKDQVSSTRHVPYIPDNRTDVYTGDQIHAYDNSAFSTGHEMQERRRSNMDKEVVPKPGYGIHNGNNPYEKENEADFSQNKKPNTTDRDSKSTLMRYEDGVIPCNNDSTPPNGSMGRRPS